jgi:phenylpropionate dioxygenase-like ring-hydroxylating dioxygenase large terminal subunit
MTFLKNAWYPAAWGHEVTRKPLARTLLNDPVVLYRTEAGAAAALEDRCCHKYVPLSLGQVTGDCLQCGYHGMTFDPSGACIRIPGQPRIPDNAWVRAYPVAEHLGLVWIWPGDPALASEDKLFDLPPYFRDGWTTNTGPHTYVKSNYRNLTDNLVDPAHVSFVHLSTLGSATMADIPVETEQIGNSVCVTRWTLDQEPVPIFKAFADFDGNVDRWQYYWFYPPSTCVVDFGSGPVGMAHDDAARDEHVRIHSCHFIAPETDTTTHYFWMQVRNFAPGDEEVSKRMTEQFVMAFDEDKEILEAVQSSEAGATRPPVKLAIDNGPNRSRRILDKLIRAEAGSAETQAAAE